MTIVANDFQNQGLQIYIDHLNNYMMIWSKWRKCDFIIYFKWKSQVWVVKLFDISVDPITIEFQELITDLQSDYIKIF